MFHVKHSRVSALFSERVFHVEPSFAYAEPSENVLEHVCTGPDTEHLVEPGQSLLQVGSDQLCSSTAGNAVGRSLDRPPA